VSPPILNGPIHRRKSDPPMGVTFFGAERAERSSGHWISLASSSQCRQATS
jgi:hypothetical protein